MNEIQSAIHNSVLAFTKEFAAKFTIDSEQATAFAQEWWGMGAKKATFSNLKQIITSSPMVSAPPSPQVKTISTIPLIPPPKPKSKEEKKNKCNYTFKVGKTAGEICGAPCAEDRCARHSKTQSQKAKSENKNIKDMLSKEPSGTEPTSSTSTSTSTSTKRKIKKQVSELSDALQKHVQDTIKKDRKNLTLVRNNYNHVIHPPTGLVYNEATQMFIGKEGPDGIVLPLNANDIELIREWHQNYELPENMTDAPTESNLEIEEDFTVDEEGSEGEEN